MLNKVTLFTDLKIRFYSFCFLQLLFITKIISLILLILHWKFTKKRYWKLLHHYFALHHFRTSNFICIRFTLAFVFFHHFILFFFSIFSIFFRSSLRLHFVPPSFSSSSSSLPNYLLLNLILNFSCCLNLDFN